MVQGRSHLHMLGGEGGEESGKWVEIQRTQRKVTLGRGRGDPGKGSGGPQAYHYYQGSSPWDLRRF